MHSRRGYVSLRNLWGTDRHGCLFTNRILKLDRNGNLTDNSKDLLAPYQIHWNNKPTLCCYGFHLRWYLPGITESRKPAFLFLSWIKKEKWYSWAYQCRVTHAWTLQHKEKNGQVKISYWVKFLGIEI